MSVNPSIYLICWFQSKYRYSSHFRCARGDFRAICPEIPRSEARNATKAAFLCIAERCCWSRSKSVILSGSGDMREKTGSRISAVFLRRWNGERCRVSCAVTLHNKSCKCDLVSARNVGIPQAELEIDMIDHTFLDTSRARGKSRCWRQEMVKNRKIPTRNKCPGGDGLQIVITGTNWLHPLPAPPPEQPAPGFRSAPQNRPPGSGYTGVRR